MKKYYTTSEFKRRNGRKITRVYKNRLARKNYHQDFTKKLNLELISRNRIKIIAPSNFSIINNPDETISFFEELKKRIDDEEKILLDSTNIETLTIDSILYLIAIFDNIEKNKIAYDIIGNLPQKKECKEIFQNSGFFNHVYSFYRSDEINEEYLQIESNNKVCNDTTKKVLEFIKKHLGKDRVELQDMKSILIELMTNSVEHAYKNRESYRSRWFLMARYDNISKEVKFSFLDRGLGIPNTVNKKMLEKLSQVTNKLKILDFIPENTLIYSALKGEFRSETKERHRGKGLPSIYEASRANYIRNLVIYANKGYINLVDDVKKDIDSTFRGTLFTWKID